MSNYHCEARISHNPYGKLAYNGRELLKDPIGNRSNKLVLSGGKKAKPDGKWDFRPRTGGKRKPTVFSAICVKDDGELPSWAKNCENDPSDPEGTWETSLQNLADAVAAAETTKKKLFRKNAQFFREIVISLPHELSEEENIKLTKRFVNEQLLPLGMVAIVDIHHPDDDGDPRNIHAHILLTMRSIGPNGFGLKVREWNSVDLLETWREEWAKLGAGRLEALGFKREADRFRVGHLTIAQQQAAAEARGDVEYAQSLNRPAQKYKGPFVTRLERERKILDEARRLEAAFKAAAMGTTIPAPSAPPKSRSTRYTGRYDRERQRILQELVAQYGAAFRASAAQATTTPPSLPDFDTAASELVRGGMHRSWRRKKPDTTPPVPPPPPVETPPPRLLYEKEINGQPPKKSASTESGAGIIAPHQIVMTVSMPSALFGPQYPEDGPRPPPWRGILIDFGHEQIQRLQQGLNARIEVHEMRAAEGGPSYQMRAVITTPPLGQSEAAALGTKLSEEYQKILEKYWKRLGLGDAASPTRPIVSLDPGGPGAQGRGQLEAGPA